VVQSLDRHVPGIIGEAVLEDWEDWVSPAILRF
jgi:hypothetical protein